jgi:transcription factor TFIIIB component B''
VSPKIYLISRAKQPVDMQTLSRMTGKDFSGPVPEIRAPTPRPTARAEQCATDDITKDSHTETGASKGVRKGKRAKRAAAEEGVVIVGNVESDG